MSIVVALTLTSGCGQIGLEAVPGLDADMGMDTGVPVRGSAGGSPDGGGSGTEDWDDSGGGSAAAEPVECTHNGFPILMHQATQDLSDPALPYFQYQARDVDTLPFDELQINSYQGAPFYGPSTPGQYSLAGSNYGDCGLCVLLVTTCNDSYQCNRVHLADQGSLEVADFGDRTGQFRAVLRDAVFREVEIDPYTYWSTPVPGGDSWCVDEIDIEVATYLYY